MSTIGSNFTFATAGTEDTLYGFTYSNLKSAAFESSDTDGFLITGAISGDLYYNAGAVIGSTSGSPNFVKISSYTYGTTNAGVQVRITGVFINNVKVSGSDPRLYWAPSPIDASGTATGVAGDGLNLNGSTSIFTVKAVDNVNGAFGNSLDAVGAGNDTTSAGTATASVNLTAVSDAPVISTNGGAAISANVDENVTTWSQAFAATDVDGTTPTWLVSGDDAAFFSFDPETNILHFTGPSYEGWTDGSQDNVFDVTVTATDGDLTDTIDVSINLQDVNETPVNTVPDTQEADPEGGVEFSVGNSNAITVSDPDDLDHPGHGSLSTLTTTLTATDGLLYLANPASGTGDGTDTVIVTGTAADINAALEGLTFVGSGLSGGSVAVSTTDGGLTSTTADIVITPGAPVVLSVAPLSTGYFTVDDVISVVVTYNQDVAVTVDVGTVSVTLDVGGVSRTAAYFGPGEGTGELIFQYQVQADEADADGVQVTSTSIALTGDASIQNLGAVNAILTLPSATGFAEVLVDTTADVDLDLAVVVADGGDGYINNGEQGAVSYTVSGLDGDATAAVTFWGAASTSVTASVSANGTYSADLSTLAEGGVTVSITATDDATNSASGSGDTFTKDTTADAAPSLSVSISDGDGYLNATEVSGSVSYSINDLDVDASATVVFVQGTNSVTASGVSGSVDLSGFADGAITATVTATDAAGNTASASGSTTKDTTSDAVGDLAVTIDDGDGYINNSEQGAVSYTITGLDADATATLTFSDGSASVTASATGVSGSVDLSSLADGNVTVTITALDSHGNASASGTGDSSTKDITADVDADLALTSGDGDGTITASEQGTVPFTVANLDADATAVVTFTDSLSATVTASVSANGSATADISSLTDGAISVSIVATDTAGNTASATGYSLSKDATADTGGDLSVSFDDTAAGAGYVNSSEATGLTFTVGGLDADATATVVIAGIAAGTSGVTATATYSVSSNGSVNIGGINSTFADGELSISISAVDVNMNSATGAGDTSILDTLAPSVASITVLDTHLTEGESTTMTIVFNEAVAGFSSGADLDMSGAGGSVSEMTSEDGITWTGTFTPGLGTDTNAPVVIASSYTDIAGNATVSSLHNPDYSVDVAPAPEFQSVVYNEGSNLLTISGSNLGSLVKFDSSNGAIFNTDIASQLDFTKMGWDVDGDGTVDYSFADTGVAFAQVVDDGTLEIVLLSDPSNVIAADANFGSKNGSNFDALVIENGFSLDPQGQRAIDDGATLAIMGDLNQYGTPMTWGFDGYEESLENETLGQFDQNLWDGEGETTISFDASIDTLHFDGCSAADFDIGGTAVAGGAEAEGVVIIWENNGLSITLEGWDASAQGIRDSNVLSFDDGSVLRTNASDISTTLKGGSGDDLLVAGSHGDRLLGNAGDDRLLGGDGADQIYGGAGDDVLYGGNGNDYLVGGSGSDTFVFNGLEGNHLTIADFDIYGSYTNAATHNWSDDDTILLGSDDYNTVAGAASGNDYLLTFESGATIRLLGMSEMGAGIMANLNSNDGDFRAQGAAVFPSNIV